MGTHYQASPATSVGLVYRSKWTPVLEGPTEFSNLPIDVPTTILKYKLPLPQQVELRIQHALSATWILGLTFDWENWTQFNNMVLSFNFDGENPPEPVQASPSWRNTYSIGANMTKVFAQGATFLNFGVGYASSPVTDKNRIIQLPADDSWTLTIGVAHNFSKALTASLGGGVVFGGSAPIEQITQGFQFAGHMRTSRVLILGGSLAWRF